MPEGHKPLNQYYGIYTFGHMVDDRNTAEHKITVLLNILYTIQICVYMYMLILGHTNL